MKLGTDNKSDVFPILDSYLISVSVEEDVFSDDQFPIVVYDSSCTVCNVENGEKVDCRTRVCISMMNYIKEVKFVYFPFEWTL